MISYTEFQTQVQKIKDINLPCNTNKNKPYDYFDRCTYLWPRLLACLGLKERGEPLDSYILNQSGLFWKSTSMRQLEMASCSVEEVPMSLFLGAVTDEKEVNEKTLTLDSWLDYDVFQGAVLTFDLPHYYDNPIFFSYAAPVTKKNSKKWISFQTKDKLLTLYFYFLAFCVLVSVPLYLAMRVFPKWYDKHYLLNTGFLLMTCLLVFITYLVFKYQNRDGVRQEKNKKFDVYTPQPVSPEFKKRVCDTLQKVENKIKVEEISAVFYGRKLYVSIDLICAEHSIFNCVQMTASQLKLFYTQVNRLIAVGHIIKKEIISGL